MAVLVVVLAVEPVGYFKQPQIYLQLKTIPLLSVPQVVALRLVVPQRSVVVRAARLITMVVTAHQVVAVAQAVLSPAILTRLVAQAPKAVMAVLAITTLLNLTMQRAEVAVLLEQTVVAV
jgi:hypothetical protein